MTPSPEVLILRHLAGCAYAGPWEIAAVLGMTPVQIRTSLVMLETMRLVVGRQDPDSRARRHVYSITAEGRQKSDIGDARAGDA